MSSHEDLLEKMRLTQAGWKPDDFRQLYEGYGFKRHEGGNHTIYRHPDFPDCRATVARHRNLSNAYARDAVKTVEHYLQQKAEREAQERAGDT